MPRPTTKSSNEMKNFSPTILQKLENAFLSGMSNTQACILSGISESFFYAVCKNNPQLMEHFAALKENTKMLAKKSIFNAIKNGDIKISQWYLEKNDKEYEEKKLSPVIFNFGEEAKKRLQKYL